MHSTKGYWYFTQVLIELSIKNIEKSYYIVVLKPKVTGIFLLLFYYQFESPHGSREMTWFSALFISRSLWTTLVKLKRWHIRFKLSAWEIRALLLPLMDRKWLIMFVRRRSKLFVLCPVYHHQGVKYWSQIMNLESYGMCRKYGAWFYGLSTTLPSMGSQHSPEFIHLFQYLSPVSFGMMTKLYLTGIHINYSNE